MKKLFLLLLLIPVVALWVWAADPQGFKIWKSQELKAAAKSEMLADFGNHNARMTFRDNDGEVEIHENWTDVIVVESGEATLAIGGTPVNPKTTAPGELRAASAAGAEKKPIAPGDILHIPAGVPHQFLVAPGKKITYFALKVPAK
jgi:mannose-6-phosphate isomerase-like protein (cupin superfamily)